MLRPALLAAVSMLAVAFGQATTTATPLMPGSDAPSLKVSEWVKGKEIKSFKPGMVYVVEFWATWCGPCKTSIPHITKLAKQHEGKVEVIGVSIWERGDDIPTMVKNFVKEFGDKMDYNVAIDSADTHMTKAWMEAGYRNGIPSAFIVNGEGKVAWIGHPMSMDKPLEDTINGTIDIEANAKEYAKYIEGRKLEVEINAKMGAANKAMAAGNEAEADALYAEAQKLNPNLAGSIRLNRIVSASQHSTELATKAFNSAKDSMTGPDMALLAFNLSRQQNPKADLVAIVADAGLGKVDAKTEVLAYYYTGMAYTNVAKWDKSVEAFEKGIANFDGGPMATDERNKGLREAMVKARDAAAAKKAGN